MTGDLKSYPMQGVRTVYGQEQEPYIWELRTPLRYGSAHAGFYRTEQEARDEALKLIQHNYGDVGLQIHTKKRVIYIDHSDE